mmetsp:Transcript_11523/g.28487  ORF Transcript_11523/g.28487 Transcript_11523/m.28487 type:complete len:214 (-) Transcript_11523:198-839(-)
MAPNCATAASCIATVGAAIASSNDGGGGSSGGGGGGGASCLLAAAVAAGGGGARESSGRKEESGGSADSNGGGGGATATAFLSVLSPAAFSPSFADGLALGLPDISRRLASSAAARSLSSASSPLSLAFFSARRPLLDLPSACFPPSFGAMTSLSHSPTLPLFTLASGAGSLLVRRGASISAAQNSPPIDPLASASSASSGCSAGLAISLASG